MQAVVTDTPRGTGPAEPALRSAVLAGDADAWRLLYEGNFGPLDRYALWRCGGRRDRADEVVQETWLVAVRKVRDFDPARGDFQNWLRGIAGRVLSNHVRKLRPLAVPPEELDGRAGGGTADSVMEVLAGLPERYEKALRAKYVDRHTVAEMAAMWSQSEKAVESVLTRARAAFKAAYLDGDER